MRPVLLLLCLCLAAPLQAATVVASIEPVAKLIHDVLGDRVTVDTFLLPTQTPHDTAFTPGQARKVQQADLVVWLGADAEPALARLLARQHRPHVAMLSLDGIHQRHQADGHDHHDHHHHAALDPHLWLSPDNMLVLARSLPAQAAQLGLTEAEVEQAVAGFARRLDKVRENIRAHLAPVAARPYMSHHDAWGYFAEAFGLRPVIPLAASTDLSPGSRHFAALVQQMAKDDIRCVMAEPESRRALLERLCQGQCRIVEADPLGRDLPAAGYTDLLETLGQRFARCLGDANQS